MIRAHGHPTIYKTFQRLSDAKAWAQETELKIRRGDFRSGASEAKKRTLQDVIEKYRDEILPHKALNSQRIETTYIKFWERELGGYALSYLSPDLISKKIAILSGSGLW